MQDNERFADSKSLEAYTSSFEKTVKAIGELTKGLGSACSELYQAKIDHQKLAASEDVARKKQALKNQTQTKAKKIGQLQDHTCNVIVIDESVTIYLIVFTFVFKVIEHIQDALPAAAGTVEGLFEAKVFEGGKYMVPAREQTAFESEQCTVDFTRPFLLPEDEVKKLIGAFLEDETFTKEAADALASFASSEERRHPKKGKGKVDVQDASVRGRVTSALSHLSCTAGELFLDSSASQAQKDAFPKLLKLLHEPDFMLTKGGKAQVIMETGSLPTAKILTSGTRQVILLKFTAIGSHVRSELGGPALKQPLSTMGTVQWLTSCGTDQFAEFVAAHPSAVYKSSMGPNELLYTPCGWLKIELGNEDACWARLSILPQLSNFLPELRIAVADLLTQGRNNVFLDNALDLISKIPSGEAPATPSKDSANAALAASPASNAPTGSPASTALGGSPSAIGMVECPLRGLRGPELAEAGSGGGTANPPPLPPPPPPPSFLA